MKKTILSIVNLLALYLLVAQPTRPVFEPLVAGSIRPAGWLKKHMQADLNGFVGKLPKLVPTLFEEDIYGKDRLHAASKLRDLGNLKSGDAEGEDQYKWWNSETQSNWWDGYIRHVFMLQDTHGIARVRQYVKRVLATQDQDGYLGIYSPELRYQFKSENGELWAKTTLLRGLLAYYGFTGDQAVWTAIQRTVENVMDKYPINQSSPFNSGEGFNGGVSHGLTFTDVLYSMYQYTSDKRYLDYAAFLYSDYSRTKQSEADAQLANILNPSYRFKAHGVHTFEHLRPLFVASLSKLIPEASQALQVYLQRVEEVTTISGAPIGDEWIAERKADETHTGYEFCSIHELLHSYAMLLPYSKSTTYAETMERLFYNAALGAHHPTQSSMAYLKTDNSFVMDGTRNGEAEPDRKQTRYKYSPVHQDVAVCCAPNAGRITPYFVEQAWWKENEQTFTNLLPMPTILTTQVHGTNVRITTETEYPFGLSYTWLIETEKPLELMLRIRKPNWATGVSCSQAYREENGYCVITTNPQKIQRIRWTWKTDPRQLTAKNGEVCFAYGPLLYAYPIPYREVAGKVYEPGFLDWNLYPRSTARFSLLPTSLPRWTGSGLKIQAKNGKTKQTETISLVPMARTALRQLSFAVSNE
jgi:DUF1680 family protein